MLDENLPAFFFRNSLDGLPYHKGVFFSIRGSEPSPAYSLRHGDPAAANARNCYAAGLFDCHNPDVLYGEVLIRPEWSHPSLSQEDIRRNGGVPPPPAPILPTQFTVQLYNPDLQVTVTQKPGSWGGSASYEFSLPQLVFRTPSASTLDRTQDDPAASVVTPKLNFVWRKESKLAKDLTCYMTGKSTDEVVKKRHRDPDITIALFRSLRELTVYEPNLYRVELEDPKGLELVLLLSAAVIKDLYFSSDVNQVFNVFDPCRIASLPAAAVAAPSPPLTNNATKRMSLPRLHTNSPPVATPTIPPAVPHAAPAAPDPRAQWELDAETARLRAQVEAEAREVKRQEAARRREKEKADEAETRRLRRMVEEEERQARQRQEEVDRETERLRKQYRVKPPSPLHNQHRHSEPLLSSHQQAGPSRPGPRFASNGLVMSGANPHVTPPAPATGQSKMKKKSFFGLRSNSDQGSNSKLSKKASAVW